MTTIDDVKEATKKGVIIAKNIEELVDALVPRGSVSTDMDTNTDTDINFDVENIQEVIKRLKDDEYNYSAYVLGNAIIRIVHKYELIQKALVVAAEEVYDSEVVQTEMETLMIGTNEEYASKEDWIERQINDWLERAKDKEGELACLK